MKYAYYNENDLFAAGWLRELIKAGHIAPGEVDTRSIEDVLPTDLAGFTQCHFFAGIGVWSYALRRAGWPDDRPVWTGSCPCQPFSQSGKGVGFADERHLWPAFFHLIRQCRPVSAFGEQVASKLGLAWLDLVSSDLEGEGYAIGANDTCAAGFGAPHIRQRLYWVADDKWGTGTAKGKRADATLSSSPVSGLANNNSKGLEDVRPQGQAQRGTTGRASTSCGLGDYQRGGCGEGRNGGYSGHDGIISCADGEGSTRPGPVNGYWRLADWLLCRDGRWRAVEPGTFPLAHGAPARVGRLRGYGGALVAPQAEEFIRAYMDIKGICRR